VPNVREKEGEWRQMEEIIALCADFCVLEKGARAESLYTMSKLSFVQSYGDYLRYLGVKLQTPAPKLSCNHDQASPKAK
jgi:hypothetical protein